MNWTGGTLRRTKNANKGVIQKQRAHFARARTRLQQSPDTLATSFRPDFLQEGDGCGDGRRISSIASGSVHSAGHTARKRCKRLGRHTTPIDRQYRREDSQRRPQEISPHFDLHSFKNVVEREERREERESRAVTDIEAHLLEANRRRLLQQQDWIGVTPSRSAGMQYQAVKERSRAGKPRISDSRTRARKQRSPFTFRHRTGESELQGQHDVFMSGALPVLAAADNIRVRIGSDAFTTAASTQPIDYAPSQTNSDSMLFDEEVSGTAKRHESEALSPSGHKLTAKSRSLAGRLAECGRTCLPQHGSPGHNIPTGRARVYADEHARHATVDPNPLSQADLPSEATEPSCRLTHFEGGTECPFKLAFQGRSTGRIDHGAWPINSSVVTQRVHAKVHAEEIESGQTDHVVGKAEKIAVRRQPEFSQIEDDGPWRPYLDTGISSSGQVRMNGWTATSVLQPHLPARSRAAESTLQPQHSVQGNLIHANLLTVSASLPTAKQQRAGLLHARPLPRADSSKGYGDDEAFWRSCAMGSDSQSAIETIHTHAATSDGSTSWATKGYASTRLPLSTAVSSVSSSPFPSTPVASLSERASRISDEAQHARRSGSRSIFSAAPSHAVWGGGVSPDGEAVPGDQQGDETSAGSLFGTHSTNASLQKHASHVTAMSSDTRMSRSALDWRSYSLDDVSRLAQAGGSPMWQRDGDSSTWDSDGAGIDLVDVDRLT